LPHGGNHLHRLAESVWSSRAIPLSRGPQKLPQQQGLRPSDALGQLKVNVARRRASSREPLRTRNSPIVVQGQVARLHSLASVSTKGSSKHQLLQVGHPNVLRDTRVWLETGGWEPSNKCSQLASTFAEYGTPARYWQRR
jgi:hypothetical protein